MKPKIGLALGAGGARGLAHIGVLKAFQEHRIPIDCIAGSSMGSFIGALYANNNDIHMIEKIAVNLKRKHWLDLSVSKQGLIMGDKAKELVRILTHGKNIEDLPIPLAVVATNIETGERVVFRQGPIDQAVRASISIPGIFVPETLDGKMLVDGGVIDRVPIQVVKEMGADLVIAVDVSSNHAQMKVESIFDVISQTIDIMEREIFRHQVLIADYLIRPDVGHVATIAFFNLQEVIDAGYEKAKESIEEIKALIDSWKPPVDRHNRLEKGE